MSAQNLYGFMPAAVLKRPSLRLPHQSRVQKSIDSSARDDLSALRQKAVISAHSSPAGRTQKQ
ncbi:hypothetical protein PDR5_28600 [Pseudomonas sp. DR 5-09]|nr:hypothetical protein PDR5_28600 [Pseudomonas sp. DR 5-09]